MGPALRRAFLRHVRVRDLGAQFRPRRAGARPARHQAALLHRAPRTLAVCFNLAGVACGRWRRHQHRSGGAAPLHEPARRRAGAADHPQGREKAAGGDDLHHRARRPSPRGDLLAARGRPASARSRPDRSGLAGSDPLHLRPCGRAAARRRRSGRRAAVGRARQLDHRRFARRTGPERFTDLLRRVRDRRRGQGRRILLFRSDRAALCHPARTHCRRHLAGHRRAAGHHRGNVRADDEPRRRRLLSAVAAGRQAREGRAKRPGRRRDFRRLSLVSGADAVQRSGRRLRAGLFRPRP